MTFLIKRCQLIDRECQLDVRLSDGRILDIAPTISEQITDTVIHAYGGLLLPGLQDHHIHLISLAAALTSVNCGPPNIEDEQQLRTQLKQENADNSGSWLRGIGYHNSVAGDIDRHWLDKAIPHRPVRLQHRGGRLWVLNTKALALLGLMNDKPPPNLPKGIEFIDEQPTGRIFECDQWLREKLNSDIPCLSEASQLLASYGITGITDTTPSNGAIEWDFFLKSQKQGKLLQNVRMMGAIDLPKINGSSALQSGEYKIHLLESQLPDFDSLHKQICHMHKTGRNIAIHCVTRTELVYALASLERAGVLPGDRIEHASVTPPDLLESIASLGLRVVSQPHFIYERGEQYLQDVDNADQPWLYRLHSFIEAGIPLAAGSDAPFGTANPWIAMQSAVSRRTTMGTPIGEQEALSPEMALALYTSEAEHPGEVSRAIKVGSEANLCLLDNPWQKVRKDFNNARVMFTWVRGKLIFQRI